MVTSASASAGTSPLGTSRPVSPCTTRLGQAAEAGGDHRQRRTHRLEHGIAEPLLGDRRRGHDVHRGEQLRDVVAKAGEADRRADAELLGQALAIRPGRSVADHQQHGVRAARASRSASPRAVASYPCRARSGRPCRSPGVVGEADAPAGSVGARPAAPREAIGSPRRCRGPNPLGRHAVVRRPRPRAAPRRPRLRRRCRAPGGAGSGAPTAAIGRASCRWAIAARPVASAAMPAEHDGFEATDVQQVDVARPDEADQVERYPGIPFRPPEEHRLDAFRLEQRTRRPDGAGSARTRTARSPGDRMPAGSTEDSVVTPWTRAADWPRWSCTNSTRSGTPSARTSARAVCRHRIGSRITQQRARRPRQSSARAGGSTRHQSLPP